MHLVSSVTGYSIWPTADEPVALALQRTARHLKEAVWTVVDDNLLINTARTADLVAVVAVHEVFERKQAVVGARSARVECTVIVVDFPLGGRPTGFGAGVGTRALYVRIWCYRRHFSAIELEDGLKDGRGTLVESGDLGPRLL